MDESRIREGTKIKITTEHGAYIKVGMIGHIITHTNFHNGEVKDRDDSYWFEPVINEGMAHICIGSASLFKILKY